MAEQWTLESVQNLRRLVEEKAPVSVIAMMMRRGAGDVHAKLAELGLSAPMDEAAETEPESSAGEGHADTGPLRSRPDENSRH